jgi:parallel beta-helix repeat protein
LRVRLLLNALEGRIAPANFTVTNANDAGAGSLRQAILDANAATGADTITFDTTFFSTPRTITLSGELAVSDSVTITGPGAANLTVNGNGAGRVFDISNSTTILNVTLSGMRITGGNITGAKGGGVFTDNENVTITDSIITGNTVGAATNSSGGGIGVFSGGSLTLRNSTVSGNSCTGRGGGIYFYDSGSLVVENSTISGNSSAEANGGGGIYFYGTAGGPGFQIRNTTISGNTAGGTGSGGGIAMRGFFGSAVIQNSTITGNSSTSTSSGSTTAGAAGGGISKPTGSGRILLQSTIVSGNTTASSDTARADISCNTISGLVTAINCAIGVDPGAGVLSPASANNLPFGANLDLQPLANNGGLNQTLGLGPNSLAVNKGSNPAGLATDARGQPRSQSSAPDIGAFESALTTPTATSAPPNVTATASTFQFTVTYAASAGVNVSTLGNGDVRVTGPGGFNQLANFVSVDNNTNGTPRVATYSITPPGGTWDPADFGTYSIGVEPGQVADMNGAFVPAIAAGSFQALVPTVTTVLNTNDSGAGSLRQAILDSNNRAGPDVINFDPTFFNVARTISLTSSELLITDSLTISGPGAGLLTVRRDPVAATQQFRIFDVNAAGFQNVTISGMTISGGSTAVNTGNSGSGTLGDGAALLMFDDSVTLDGVVITGNTSGTEGGGVAVSSVLGTSGGGGSLTIRNSTVSGNTALGAPPPNSFGGAGGGIYFANGGSLLLENTLISGNTSTNFEGGGVYFYGAVGPFGVTIRNSTITGNTANGTMANGSPQGGNSGGLYLGTLAGSVVIQNSTIANNVAGIGPGGGMMVSVVSGGVSLTSTVVANNTGPGAPDVSGPVTANFSLIRDQTGATVTGSNNLPAGTNPMLGALANNGGTSQTMALLAGSPLINAGSNPANLTTDQRGPGFARVSGPAADIGAFEVQSALPSVQSVVVNAGQANTVQRSSVTSVTVTFDRLVTFVGAQTAAFQLARISPGSPTGNVTLTVDLTGSTATQTIAKLTFSGSLTDGSATALSLIDGNYTLTVFSNQITGGLNGGDSVSTLFRYYGDVNGDRTVNGLDLAEFRSAFGTSLGNPNYLPYLDQNGDGAINGLDLAIFRTHFGTTLGP